MQWDLCIHVFKIVPCYSVFGSYMNCFAPLLDCFCLCQEEDFQEMILSAQIMESQYGHLFDKVIVNDDLTTAYNELKATFEKLENETFWVPVSWVHS